MTRKLTDPESARYTDLFKVSTPDEGEVVCGMARRAEAQKELNQVWGEAAQTIANSGNVSIAATLVTAKTIENGCAPMNAMHLVASMAEVDMKSVSLLLPVFGGIVEVVGFVFLAFELLRTNKSFLKYTGRISGDVPTFCSMIISDGLDGSGESSGGIIGETVPAARELATEVNSGKIATYVGLGVTAFGAMLQIAGATMAYYFQ
ncbi:hypothetical protein AAE026_29300 [Bradyrhizobium sp. DN5]|uniref:hypothetical protein n=1 Tax=Bradyrhizobium sp. DN5 TaxID=3056950 RepID=UPI0035242AA7